MALRLAEIYPVKKDILIPACLLHDLGRSKPYLHGLASVEESCRQAKILLAKAGYNQQEIKLICRAIAQHDQPALKTVNWEAKILKEADFLDGFGARGIYRYAYWSGESGRDFDQSLKRLTRMMKQRHKSLELPESRFLAGPQYAFAQVFFDNLLNPVMKNLSYKGKYLVFEGISGTGKETQVRLLKNYLDKKGRKAEIIYHPTPRLKKTLGRWRQDKIDAFTEAFLLIADRADMFKRKIWPALKNNKIVISLRSGISTLVYQAQDSCEINLFAYLYSLFEPEPDLIFYFSLQSRQALARINQRFRKTGETKGRFENLKDLNAKQKKYQKIIKRYKKVITLNAALTIGEIHQKIIDNLKPILL